MAEDSVLKMEISIEADECDFIGDKEYKIKNEETLVAASAAGHYEEVAELLNSGVLVDADEYNKLLLYASKHYRTPLQLASANGHSECVQILIDHGADVNAKDHFGLTALHVAAEKGHFLCLKALLDAGADCSSPSFSKPRTFSALPHPRGTAPLHLATTSNHVDCVTELIGNGADCNAINEHGQTSLYIATKLGFEECALAHLKNAGRRILSLPDFVTADTPLHFAVFHRMVDCIRELLSLGSDANHFNKLGVSPLQMAIIPTQNRDPDIEILKLLVLEGYNTDINPKIKRYRSPLHYACFGGTEMQTEMAKFLIAYGANVNITNSKGKSLIYCQLNSFKKEYDILQFIVNSLLQLPFVKYLDRFPIRAHNNLTEHNPSDNDKRVLRDKLLWYQEIALKPRTLQHCCRYEIRKSLGPHNMKDVSQLPIPEFLRSYILLHYDNEEHLAVTYSYCA